MITKSKNHTGAMGELWASQWFLQQGLEVFLNVPSTGPADLVVWNTDTKKMLPVDIKSLSCPLVRNDGSVILGSKVQFREDGVAQCAYIVGEPYLHVPVGFWKALGMDDLDTPPR